MRYQMQRWNNRVRVRYVTLGEISQPRSTVKEGELKLHLVALLGKSLNITGRRSN